MARKRKFSDDELNQLDEGTISVKDLAANKGVTEQSVRMAKYNRSLKLRAKVNQADQNIVNAGITPSTPTPDAPAVSPDSVTPVINYHDAVKGIWQGADTLFFMFSKLSKGALEYDKCTSEEIERLTSVSENNSAVQKLSELGGITTVIMVGTIVGTFGSKIRIRKQIKHDPYNTECKCNECKKLPLQINLKTENTENVGVNKTLVEKTTEKINESREDKNDGTIRLEKNVINSKTLPTEEEVIKRNTGKGLIES